MAAARFLQRLAETKINTNKAWGPTVWLGTHCFSGLKVERQQRKRKKANAEDSEGCVYSGATVVNTIFVILWFCLSGSMNLPSPLILPSRWQWYWKQFHQMFRIHVSEVETEISLLQLPFCLVHTANQNQICSQSRFENQMTLCVVYTVPNHMKSIFFFKTEFNKNLGGCFKFWWLTAVSQCEQPQTHQWVLTLGDVSLPSIRPKHQTRQQHWRCGART